MSRDLEGRSYLMSPRNIEQTSRTRIQWARGEQQETRPRLLNRTVFIIFLTLLRIWWLSFLFFFGSQEMLIFKRSGLGSHLCPSIFIPAWTGWSGVTSNHFMVGFHFYPMQRLTLGFQNTHGRLTTHATFLPFPNGLCPIVMNGARTCCSFTQVSKLII